MALRVILGDNMPTKEYEKFYEFIFEMYDPESEIGVRRASYMKSDFEKYFKAPGKILDLCCGAGVYAFLLEELGFEVVGLDIQKQMIIRAREIAKKRKSKVIFMEGDARKLEFPDNHFDYVIFLGNSLPHFNINEFDKVLNEVYRVLKNNGLFMVGYTDFIWIMLERYRFAFVDLPEKSIVSFHAKYDGEDGSILKLCHNFDTNETFKIKLHVWAPWILRHLCEKHQLKLHGKERTAENVYIDVFKLEK